MLNRRFLVHGEKITERRFSVKEKQRHTVSEVVHNFEMDKAGRRIRELRKERKMTQPQLTDATGIPQSTISELERGESKVPSGEVLVKLAQFFEVEPTWILTGKGPRQTVSSSTDHETELLLYYRSLSREGKDYLLARARFMHGEEHQGSPRRSGQANRLDEPDDQHLQ